MRSYFIFDSLYYWNISFLLLMDAFLNIVLKWIFEGFRILKDYLTPVTKIASFFRASAMFLALTIRVFLIFSPF